MSITVRKGLIGTGDIKFYSSASPTFSRYSSSGGVTTATSVGATHIPILNATGYFQTSNVERALQDIMTRYYSKDHSIATYAQGGAVGDHVEVMGFRNGFAATSIQAAASNMYLSDGIARIVLPEGTITAATPIALPRKTFLFGNGRGTVIRASSTIQTSRVFSIAGSVAATNSALAANATADTSVVGVSDGTKFAKEDWIIVRGGATAAAATMELHQVKSVSGNDLTVYGKLIHTFRSAGTLAHASIVYPAELVMDNLTIQCSSATQGIGVAGTYMVNSKIGDQVFIFGTPDQMVLAKRSSYNDFAFSAENQNSTAATHTYSLFLNENSHVNKVTGRRLGQLKDVAASSSKRNFVWGTTWNGTYSASNMDGITQATGSMHVYGKVKFHDGVYGDTTFDESVAVGGLFTSTGNATFGSSVYITSGATIGGVLRSSGNATFGSSVFITGNATIGDGTGTATTPNLLINNNTGDSVIRLQVNNSSANAWDIVVDNDDNDDLEFFYNGTMRFEYNLGDAALNANAGNGVSGDYFLPKADDTTAPGANRLYKANVPKAWAHLDVGAGGAVTVTNGHNVSSASWTNENLTVVWDTDFADATYYAAGNYSTLAGGTDTTCWGQQHAVGSAVFEKGTSSTGNANVWASGDDVEVFAIGDQ